MDSAQQMSLFTDSLVNQFDLPKTSSFARQSVRAIAKRSARTETAPQTSTVLSNITQLVISKYCANLDQLLLPMIARQTQLAGNRWVSWVSDEVIDKNVLLDYGVNLKKLRIIYPNNTSDLHAVTEKALVAGTSHCVVAIFDGFSDQQLAQLTQAANTGNCSGLLVTHQN